MIVAPWGDEKTGKSAFALTFPKPIIHFDMDFGFGRVEDRFREEIEKGLIVSTPYPVEIKNVIFTSSTGRPLEGYREVYEQVIVNFVEAIQDKKVETIVIDTATQLWEIVRLGFLQEKQELQDPEQLAAGKIKLRERLLPIEYGEPNNRMKQIIQSARMMDKHLVMVHYAKDEYRPMMSAKGSVEEKRTGKLIMDSFKHVPDLSDIVIQTSRNSTEFFGEIVLCGLDVRLEGMKFADPTYEMVIAALEGLKKGGKTSG